jgi:hypothetical protein
MKALPFAAPHSSTSPTVNLTANAPPCLFFRKLLIEHAPNVVQARPNALGRRNSHKHGLRSTITSREFSQSRLPDNCTKPIKKDTVPFHAA